MEFNNNDDSFAYGELYGITPKRSKPRMPLPFRILAIIIIVVLLLSAFVSSGMPAAVAVSLQRASRTLNAKGFNVSKIADVTSQVTNTFNINNVQTVIPDDFWITYNVDMTQLSLERFYIIEAAYMICTYDDGAVDNGASGIALYSQGGCRPDDSKYVSKDYIDGSLSNVHYVSGTTLSRALDWTSAYDDIMGHKTFGTDCSGFVITCMDYVDVKCGTSYKKDTFKGDTGCSTMMTHAEKIDYDKLAPGDIFINGGHTGIFLGWKDKAKHWAYTAESHTHPWDFSSGDMPDKMRRSVALTDVAAGKYADLSQYPYMFHVLPVGGYTPQQTIQSQAPMGQTIQLVDGTDKYARFYIPSNLTYMELGGYADQVQTNDSDYNWTAVSARKQYLNDRVGSYITRESSMVSMGLVVNATAKARNHNPTTDGNGVQCLKDKNGTIYYPITLSNYFVRNTSVNNFLGYTFYAASNECWIARVNLSDGTSVNCFLMDAIGTAHSCRNGVWTDDKPVDECQDQTKYHCVPMKYPEYEYLYHAAGLHVIEGWSVDNDGINAYNNVFFKGGATYIVSIDLTDKQMEF